MGEKSEKYLNEITSYMYDAVINVGEVYFWVKKDGKWSAIDRNNKTIFKSPTILEKYQKLPSLNFEDYIQAQRDGKLAKSLCKKHRMFMLPTINIRLGK